MPIAISRSSPRPLLLGGVVLLAVLTLVSCMSSPSRPQTTTFPSRPQTTTFNDLELPPPKPVGGARVQPPPAWLIIGDQAVPATYGSFCAPAGCFDMAPPDQMPDLATADLPAGEQATIVVGSDSVRGFRATVQDWTTDAPTDPGAEQYIAAEGKVEGSQTIFTLASLTDTDDQLLQAVATFGEGGDASYLWRLNPAQ